MRFAICLLLMLTIFKPANCAAGDVSKSELVSLLQELERSATGYRWSFSFTSIPQNKKGSEDKSPSRIDGKVTYDVNRRFYKLEATTVLDWVGGLSKRMASRFGMSYDGTIYRHWKHDNHGEELPPVIKDEEAGIDGIDPHELEVSPSQLAPTGEIDVKIYPGFDFSLYWSASSLAFFPPTLNPEIGRVMKLDDSAKMSTFLDSCDPNGVTITTRENDRFYRVLLLPPAIPVGRFELEFDIKTLGLLSLVDLNTKSDGSGQTFYRQTIAYDDSGKVPRRIAIEKFRSPTVEIVLSEFEMLDNLRVEDFTLRFPPGTFITDRVEGKYYQVGQDLSTETAAVKAFINREGLAPLAEGTSHQVDRGFFRKNFLLANGIFFGSLLFFWGYKKLRVRKETLMLLCLAIASSCSASEHSAADGWTVSHANSQIIRTSQCGYNVAVLALELGDRIYTPSVLSEMLKPQSSGVRMSDLKRALESHGLDVSVRKEVALEDFESGLAPNQLAVFAIGLSGGRKHYLVAMKRPGARVVVLDAPVKSMPLTDAVIDQFRGRKDLVVLICSRLRQEESQLHKRLTVEPPNIDLGVFHIDSGQETISNTVVVRNTSELPIVVTSLKSSCGCTTLGWPGGVIDAGQSVELGVSVSISKWGPINGKKVIVASFGDGTTKTIEIHGRGERSLPVRPTEAERLITVPLAPCGALSGLHEIGPALFLVPEGRDLKEFEVFTSGPEVQTEFVPYKNSSVLKAKVQLSNPTTTWEGSVTIGDKESKDKTSVGIAIIREKAFLAATKVLDVPETHAARFHLEKADRTIRVVGVSLPKDSGFSAEFEDNDDSTILVVSRTTTSNRTAILKIRAKCSVSEATSDFTVILQAERSEPM